MKIKNSLFGFVCISASFLIITGCGKRNNSTNPTTTITTTEEQTTQEIPGYSFNEKEFALLFNHNTFEELYNLNFTANFTHDDLDDNKTTVGVIKKDKDAYLYDYSNNGHSTQHTVVSLMQNYKDGVDISSYFIEDDGLDHNYDDTFSRASLAKQQIFFANLDKNKFVFNDDTKEYVYSKSVEIDGDINYGYKQKITDSNIKIKFDNHKLVSLSFNRVTNNYVGDEIKKTFNDNYTYEFSNIGTTVVPDLINDIYLVNEETFNSYFNLTDTALSSLNLTIDYEGILDGDNFEGRIAFDGTQLLEKSKDIDENINYTLYRIITSINNGSVNYDYYSYNSETGWASKQEFTKSIDAFIFNGLDFPLVKYSDVSFNRYTKSYEVANLSVGDAYIFKNVKIRFYDDKLDSIFYEVTCGGTTDIISATISKIGGTTVFDPRP